MAEVEETKADNSLTDLIAWRDSIAMAEGRLSARACEQVGGPILIILVYFLSFAIFGPDMMLPMKGGFALYSCWIGGLLGGRLMGSIGQPPLLGMLIAGLALRNLLTPIIEPLPDKWAGAVRVFGLSVILMRSGLELDLSAIARIGPACVRLTVCPGCSEAMMVGAAAFVIFEMPLALALSLGFILAAVSPAVVVGGMFDLQRRGYGTAKGIPSLVVAAASFDDVVAITGYSLAIGFAISDEHSNILMEALHGPINVGLGTLLGFIGGIFCSRSLLWNEAWKRTAITAIVGLTFAFACDRVHYTGAGALASLVTTCVTARQWGKLADERDVMKGKDHSQNHDRDDHDDPAHWAHLVELELANVWTYVAQPMLFCVIGASLSFSTMDPGTIPMSIAVVTAGVLVRCPVAALVTFGARMSFKERAFVGAAWIPKATVQAALGALPLDLVRTTLDPEHDPENFKKYEKWGLQILTTAVFSILITAPIGLLVIQNFGHRALTLDGTGARDSKVHEQKAAPATVGKQADGILENGAPGNGETHYHDDTAPLKQQEEEEIRNAGMELDEIDVTPIAAAPVQAAEPTTRVQPNSSRSGTSNPEQRRSSDKRSSGMAAVIKRGCCSNIPDL